MITVLGAVHNFKKAFAILNVRNFPKKGAYLKIKTTNQLLVSQNLNIQFGAQCTQLWNAACHLKANHETIISKAHNFVLYSTSCEMVDEKKIGENGFAKMGRSTGFG